MDDAFKILATSAVIASFGGLIAANATVIGLRVLGRNDVAKRLMVKISPALRYFRLPDISDEQGVNRRRG